jgi:CelD/BcsL family acetyltransferase involved in cellulose biosynthesis
MNLLALDDPRWHEFVESRSDASIFHHPAWAGLLADCYGYRAGALALEYRGGALSAGLPVIDVSGPIGGRRWMALPFSDSCSVLASDRSTDVIAALREVSRAARLDVLEVRAALGDDAFVQTATPFVRHELALDAEPQLIWERFRKNHRRSVRDAERAGVRIVRGTSASDLEVFYALHLRTRRRLGVPIQPRRFFRLLLERVIQRGLGFVLTAYAGPAPVAAAVFGSWNGTVTYKFGGRDERLPKLDANHLLFWTAIRQAIEEGQHALDFGRSSVEQTQLRSFKSGWGAAEEPLSYSWIAKSKVRHGGPRAEKAMALLIRNTAPWVCRTIGEVFYKYAA